MNALLTDMLRCADPAQVPGLSRFFKTGPGQYGEGDRFLGIKVPVTRQVVKRHWRETGFPELEECLASEYHEVRLAGLLCLVEVFSHARKDPALQQRCVDFYLAHTDGIDNWDLVDLSCYPLLGVWLLDKDRTLLYELARNDPAPPPARPDPQGHGLAAARSRQARQGRPRGLPGATLPGDAPHHAPLRHRKVPGARTPAVSATLRSSGGQNGSFSADLCKFVRLTDHHSWQTFMISPCPPRKAAK